MTRLYNTASAAIAALILAAGATSASAQTWVFNQPAGTPVQATGILFQDVDTANPSDPDLATTCQVTFDGVTADDTPDSDGKSDYIAFASYTGVNLDGGPLDCGNSLGFPIQVRALDELVIRIPNFVVGTRNGPCDVTNYDLDYFGNEAVFDGTGFGSPPICHATGNLAIDVTSGGADVEIVLN